METHDKKRHLNNGVEPEGVKKAAHWSLDFPARNCVSDPDRPALVDLCQRTGVCRRDSGPLAASSERTDGDKAEKSKKARRHGRAHVRSLVDPIAPTATPRIKRTRAGILKVPVLSLWHTQSLAGGGE